MDKPIFETTTENGFKYSIFFCDLPLEGSFDFGSDEENQAYLKRFEDGELESYYVTKSKKCPCCSNWEVIDSLSGIHASDTGEALQCAMEQMQEATV